MKSHLADLDELCSLVRSENSKKYITEAIDSYRVGAYRSSVIATWISICVDIIDKIRELKISNDKTAEAINKRLESISPDDVQSMLAFEKEILDIACDELEILSVIEKQHLGNLRFDRNLCAHPTYSIDGSQFSPGPELCRTYIVQAINYLLKRTPTKGKATIDSVFTLIIGETFPQEDEKAYKLLSSNAYLGRVKESTIRNLLIIILKRIFRDETGIPSELMFRLLASLHGIERLYPEIYKNVLHSKLTTLICETSDVTFKRVFPLLVKRGELYSYIDASINVRIETLVEVMKIADLQKYLIPDLASNFTHINECLKKRIENLNQTEKESLLDSFESESLKPYAMNVFQKSNSFGSAYNNGYKFLTKYGDLLTEDELQSLFEGILENNYWGINQILNAGRIGEVFYDLYIKTKSNVRNHEKIWLSFWEKISKENDYEELRNILIKDGLVESDKQESDDGTIPF